MPETSLYDTAFLKKIRSYANDGGGFDGHPWVMESLIEEFKPEIVGYGMECVVLPSQEEPEKKVVAFSYKTLPPEEAKRIFYSQRILSTLFPHNFPHFYSGIGVIHQKNLPGQ